MRTSELHARSAPQRWPHASFARLLPMALLLLTLPAAVRAEDFLYVTNNDATIRITAYIGPGGDVTVPDRLPAADEKGLPVTNIGERAFYECTSLTGIIVPNSVTSIGSYAFYGCTRLTSISIPDSVTNIGIAPFAYCTSLSGITVDPINPAYTSVEGVLFNESQTILIQCPATKAGPYIITNSVSSIESYAFYRCTNLTSIDIPDSVTNIGNYAFYECTSLSNSTIPNSVNNIGNYAFWACTSLTNLTLGNGVINIGGCAFAYCSSLSSITIPNGVTSIGDRAFDSCSSLGSITIPDSVTDIGYRAFNRCTNLTSIRIPNSVTSIGLFAFEYCTSLTGVYCQGNAPAVARDAVSDTSSLATIYYLPGTSGWGLTWGGRPTALWQPQMQTVADTFGVQTNQFGFNIAWSSGMTFAIEACTDLASPSWTPLQTNTLTADTLYFGDSDWTNAPRRFFRVRWP